MACKGSDDGSLMQALVARGEEVDCREG
jgi:hypothetical protein